MKVEKVLVTYIQDGAVVVLEHLNMEMKDVAHALIELAQPKLDIKVTDERRKRFRDEAKKAFIKYKGNLDFDSFVALSEEKDVEKFFAVERCNHAYNEMVMGFAPMKKKVFHFDFWTGAEKDADGKLKANLWTQSITAWDEEHATLLFEKMHPGKSYDKPY